MYRLNDELFIKTFTNGIVECVVTRLPEADDNVYHVKILSGSRVGKTVYAREEDLFLDKPEAKEPQTEKFYKTTITLYSTKSMKNKDFEELHKAEQDNFLVCEEQTEISVPFLEVPEYALKAFNMLDCEEKNS